MTRFFLFLLAFSAFSSIAQTQKVRATMDDKQFYAPEIGEYIEIQLQFVGHSVKYKSEQGGLIGEVAIRMAIKSGDNLVASDAYRLKTPLMKDSIIEDFYDVRRFPLTPGNYSFEIELQDLNAEGTPIKSTVPLYVGDYSKLCNISDIQVSEVVVKGDGTSDFFKSGYDMYPHMSTFYPQEINKLPVYFEVYNTALLGDSVFGIKQSVTDMMNGKEVENMTQFTRHKVAEVVPVLKPVDITMLPTGKYSLDFSVIRRDLSVVTKKSYEFERSNDIGPSVVDAASVLIDPAFQASITNDSVDFYLASLIPMSAKSEVKRILAVLKSKDKELERKEIQAFWIATSGAKYYNDWMKYKQQVLMVEGLYKNNFQAGYETDRGRVYLQYGPPTTVVAREVSSNEYPYEIWQYNKIGKYSNKRFVFYNPDLVNNAYRLLHSDMIGELKNNSWELALNKRNTTFGNVDDPNANIQQSYGSNSSINYK